MVTIGRNPGESTMIRISQEVREMIETEKIIPREPLNECIKRLIIENRNLRPRSLMVVPAMTQQNPAGEHQVFPCTSFKDPHL